MNGKSETLANRLAGIITLFNSGKAFSVAELAEEFGVTKRTIQKDLNSRLIYLPIMVDTDNRYRLDTSYLGKFTSEDIKLFAHVCGLRGLFPGLNQKLMTRLLHNFQNEAFMVIGHTYETVDHRQDDFYRMEEHILRRKKVKFEYKGKQYRDMSPYRLISQSGIWYLAVLDPGGKLKSFHFNNVKRISVTGEIYQHDPAISKKIEESGSIWFEEGQDIQTITVRIEKEIVPYFTRRQMLPRQEIVRENEDGSVILKTRTGNRSSLLHKVFYWIPNIQVLKPEGFRDEVLGELERYIRGK